MREFMPPGGVAGFAQMTPASRIALTRGTRGSAAPRRRRRKSAAASRPRRARKSSGRKLKFGTPAWQKKYRVGKFAKKRR